MIRGSLTIPGHIVITTMIVFISHMQIEDDYGEGQNCFCVQLQSQLINTNFLKEHLEL